MFVPLLVTSLDGFLSAPQDIAVHAPEYREEVKTVADLYPPKTEVFLLHPTYYGCQAEVRACVCLYMCTLMCACVFGILGATVRGIKKLPSTGVRTPVGQTARTRTYARAYARTCTRT